MDFSTICRTCIKSFDNIGLNPIFLSEDTHERFSSAFYSCTGIQVKLNDGLPQNICTACMRKFNNTLKFRKQCKQAETQLLKIKTELESKNTEDQPVFQKKMSFEKKSDCQNFTRIKSELQSIKKEPIEIYIEEDQPLKYFINKSDVSLLSNDDDDNLEENSDTDFFNEEERRYPNDNDLKTETTLQQNSRDYKCDIYSRTPLIENYTELKTKELTLNDNKTNVLETSFDSNNTEKKKVDIPYIITETATKKTVRVVCKLCVSERESCRSGV